MTSRTEALRRYFLADLPQVSARLRALRESGLEGEKGAVTGTRTVARLKPAAELGGRKLVRSGNVVHTIWVPSWTDPADEESEWAVDLRTITTVDRAYLHHWRRVEAASYPAWIAVIRRLALFFGRIRLTPAEAASFAGEFIGDPEYVA